MRTLFLTLFGFALIAAYPAKAAIHSCLMTTALVEQKENIPRGLLYAIALTESGRWNKEKKFSHAWPWTIRSKADGFVLDSKSEAIATVEKLKRSGRKNIDVGCMQINLKYHPNAFTDLNQAFEPRANVTYAARFLASLRKEAKSWQQAIEWYHSRDGRRGHEYRKKVYSHWRQAQTDVYRAHQALAQVNNGIIPASLAADDGPMAEPLIKIHRGTAGNAAASAQSGQEQARTSSRGASIVAGAAVQRGHDPESAGRSAIHGVDVVRPGRGYAGLFKSARHIQ